MTVSTQLSVRKIVDGFAGFGFQDEGRMVEKLLKSIGSFNPQRNDYTFTPKDVQNYLLILKGGDDPFSESNIEHLIRGLQQGGYEDLSKESMAQFLTDHKIYLSRQEIDTFMTVIADEGTQSVDYVTPEQLKKAIIKSKRESSNANQMDQSPGIKKKSTINPRKNFEGF